MEVAHLLEGLDLLQAKPIVRPLNRPNFPAVRFAEPCLLVNQHLHFVGVVQKKLQVKPDQRTQAPFRSPDGLNPLLGGGQNGFKGMALDEVKQLFFA